MNDIGKMLNEADWAKIQLKLARYTYYKLSKGFPGGVDGLPMGIGVEDLVCNAIEKTVRGASANEAGHGVRKWNPGNQPDLLKYLMGVVRSDISCLIKTREKNAPNYASTSPREEEDVATIFELSDYYDSDLQKLKSSTPEAVLISKEEHGELISKFDHIMDDINTHFTKQNDTDVLLLILSYQELFENNDSVKPSMIAEHTGLHIEAVYNAMKRLRRFINDGGKR